MARYAIGTRRPGRGQRRAAAVVEMAVVSPLLLLLVFGIIEYGYTFMVQETATNAAREACRMAVLQGVDRDDVVEHFKKAMSATGLTDGAVSDGVSVGSCGSGQECDDWTLELPDQTELDDRSSGNETVTITVTVPNSKISLAGLASFVGLTSDVKASCTMRKEGLTGS